MATRELDIQELRLLGGRLCIDFVNTVENRAGDRPEELLISYADLVRWGQHAGLLDEPEATRLLALASTDGQAAEQVLGEALRLRETLHRTLLAIAGQQAPVAGDLQTIKDAYCRAVQAAVLARVGGGFEWDWRTPEPRLDQLFRPIAFSAVELLMQDDLRRVKVCANPHGCGWLFYDNSKNASRRWCRMEGCGSQAKMRRQYAKRRRTHSSVVQHE